jgi:hypothetical protein
MSAPFCAVSNLNKMPLDSYGRVDLWSLFAQRVGIDVDVFSKWVERIYDALVLPCAGSVEGCKARPRSRPIFLQYSLIFANRNP